MVIATRIMALNETLDFDLDPRGVIPAEMKEIRELVTLQMRFVIGHEYAHHGLGHLGTGATKIRAMSGDTKRSGWLAIDEAGMRSSRRICTPLWRSGTNFRA